MSEVLPMFDQETSPDTPSAISLPALGPGVTPCDAPSGPIADQSGPVPVLVNPSQRQASAKRKTTRGIYGQIGFDSSRHDDLSYSLASKFRLLTDSLGSTLFNLTWTVRVTPAGRSIYARRALGRPTSGNDCTSWPTPDTGMNLKDSNWENRRKECKAKHGNNGFGLTLGMASTLAAWPTPVNGRWANADWLRCRDGKWRPTESRGEPMAPGIAADLGYLWIGGRWTLSPLVQGAKGRVPRLRGYGDAIVAPLAQAFIEAYMSLGK